MTQFTLPSVTPPTPPGVTPCTPAQPTCKSSPRRAITGNVILAVIGFTALLTAATMDVVPLADSAPMTVALSPTHSLAGGIANRSADVDEMLRNLNARRTGRGLRPLALDPRLCTIARSHAVDMVQRNYFGHDTPEGASPFDRMKRAHYPFGYAGENIALNRDADAAAMALWHSTEHRNNMLGTHYVKVGIAAADSTDGEIFVEDFSD